MWIRTPIDVRQLSGDAIPHDNPARVHVAGGVSRTCASVPSSKPSSTIRDASLMHARMPHTSEFQTVSGAPISTASCRGGADFDPAFRPQTAGHPQRFSAVGLHREIPQRARVDGLIDMNMPPKNRAQRTVEHVAIEGGVRPAPDAR